MIIEKDFYFDAAHFLPYAPEGHKCRRLHGHTYKVTIALKGKPKAKEGWICDFGEIKDRVKPILDQLDHRLLNAISGLENPTAENIAFFIYEKLKDQLPELYFVCVQETPTSRAIYGKKIS